jgi:tol-pal system protein YbgF
MMRAHRVAAAALAAAFALALPARAALFDDDEARKRIEITNQRLTQVQKQLEDRLVALETQLKAQGLVDLLNSVDQMRGDIAKVRGQLEVITYELEQQNKRSRDLYVDIDTRLRKLETAASAPSSTSSTGATPGGPTGSLSPSGGTPTTATDVTAEQRAYDAALDQFKAGNYTAAAGGFAQFVKMYPKSPLAPSGQYWLGNAQFALRDYRSAIASQRALMAMYPDSQKVPDAMLNIASSQFEMGDGVASRRTLEELIAKHPQSDAATKARQRLAIR